MTTRRMRAATVLLGFAVLILSLFTLVVSAHGQTQEAGDEREFNRLWNQVGDRWNAAAYDLQAGKMPRDKIAKVDQAIEELRRNKFWVKHKESR